MLNFSINQEPQQKGYTRLMRRTIAGLLLGVVFAITSATIAGAVSQSDERWMLSHYNQFGNVSWERDASGHLPSSMIVGNYHVLTMKSGQIFRIDGTTGAAFVAPSLTAPSSTWHPATLSDFINAALDNWSVVHALAWGHPAIASMAISVCAADKFYADLAASAADVHMYLADPHYGVSITWLATQNDVANCLTAYDLVGIGRIYAWIPPYVAPEPMMPI